MGKDFINFTIISYLSYFQHILANEENGKKFREVLEANPTRLMNIALSQVKLSSSYSLSWTCFMIR